MPFRGDRLQGIREFRQLGRSDLASLAGLDPAGLQRLEDGTTKNPRSDSVERLAENLDLTTDYLMGAGPDMPFPRAAVLQALERFKRTEGWRFEGLDEAALARAAEDDDAHHTVAGWRGFVSMSARAWNKPRRPSKRPQTIGAASSNRRLRAVEPRSNVPAHKAVSLHRGDAKRNR